MIELDGVRKLYHEGRSNQVVAIEEISLNLPLDRTVVFKGPSGSGKTTLLTLIGCLARPTSGRIRIEGELVSNLPERFLTKVRRRTFGFVFQRFNLISGLSVLENVMLPAYPLGLPHKQLGKRALAWLERLSIAHRAETPAQLLSGGEAQRVAIARALINDPKIIIADEPTANLDSRLTDQFLAIAAELREEGKTVLMTSHDERIWQAPLVDEVIALADGRLTLNQQAEAKA